MASLSTAPYFSSARVTNGPSSEEYAEYKESSMQYWFILHAILVPVLFGMISLVGLIGNILVIYVILSNSRMRTVINLLLLNLAVADLCFVIVVPPFTAHQYIGNAYGSHNLYEAPTVTSGSKQRLVQRRSADEALQNFKEKSSDKVAWQTYQPSESSVLANHMFMNSFNFSKNYHLTLENMLLSNEENQKALIEHDDLHFKNEIHNHYSSVQNKSKSKLGRLMHQKTNSSSSSYTKHKNGHLQRVLRDAIYYNREDGLDDVAQARTSGGRKQKASNWGRSSSGSDSPAGSATAAACKLFHYIVNATAYCTVYTLVMIAALRYMTVVHNVRTIRIRTRRNVIIIISLLWILVLLSNIPVLIVYDIIRGPDPFSAELGQYDLSNKIGQQQKCDVSREVGQRLFLSFFLLAYVFPLLAIALLSAAILRHLAKHRAGFERASVRLDDDTEARSRDSASRACCSRLWYNLSRMCCCGCRCGRTQINGGQEEVVNGGRTGAGEVEKEERVRLHKCDSGRSAAGTERRGSEAESVSVTRGRGWNCCGYDNPTNQEANRGQQEDGTRLRHPQGSRTAEMKRQASRLIVLVVVMFAISWLPINIHLLVTFYMDTETRGNLHSDDVYKTFVVICNCLAYVNSCVNPFIYSHVSKDFRDAFRDAVGCRRRSTVAMEGDHMQMLPPDQRRRDRRDNGLGEDIRGETGHVHLTPLSPNRVQREQQEEQEYVEGRASEHVEGQTDRNQKASSEKISSKEASSDRGSSATGFCNQLVVANNDEIDEDKGLVDVRVDIDVSISG